MNSRLIAITCILLAGYLAFGDSLHASWTQAPESFVADVGRGVGTAVSGVAATVFSVFGG